MQSFNLKINILKFVSIFLFFSFLFFSFCNSSYALTKWTRDSTVQVSGLVGEFYLDVSGYVSPRASIVMTSDKKFVRSTVANSNGDFYISQILIKNGFSGFCLEAVDYKQIGHSLTCFSFPPATSSMTKKDLFLPPTLALQKDVISEGKEAVAYGFSMPNSTVTLYLSNGRTLNVKADNNGYFQFKITNLKAGTYNLYAKAVYKNIESLAPSRKLELKALSLPEEAGSIGLDILKKIKDKIDSFPFGQLWVAVPIIILIIILLIKLLMPEKKITRGKHLHHYWLVGE